MNNFQLPSFKVTATQSNISAQMFLFALKVSLVRHSPRHVLRGPQCDAHTLSHTDKRCPCMCRQGPPERRLILSPQPPAETQPVLVEP